MPKSAAPERSPRPNGHRTVRRTLRRPRRLLPFAITAGAIAALVVVAALTASRWDRTTTGTVAAAGPAGAPAVAVPASAPAVTVPRPAAAKPISLDATATVRKALTARITSMQAVQGVAVAPGDVAGPSVRFSVSITNRTGRAVDLTGVVVNAAYGSAETPAIALSGPGGKVLPDSVADGATVVGAYVFNIPATQRTLVHLTLDTAVSDPLIVFTGSVPR